MRAESRLRHWWVTVALGALLIVWGVSRAIQIGWSWWAIPCIVGGCVLAYTGWRDRQTELTKLSS